MRAQTFSTEMPTVQTQICNPQPCIYPRSSCCSGYKVQVVASTQSILCVDSTATPTTTSLITPTILPSTTTRASSTTTLPPAQFTLYQGISYTGYSGLFDFPTSATCYCYSLNPLLQNQVSAIQMPSGYCVILYTSQNCTGCSMKFTTNVSNFVNIGFDNMANSYG